jgi:hypothetical protein
MRYVANSTEFVNSRRLKGRGTSGVSGGSRTHFFLNMSRSVWTKKVNSRSESLSRVLHALPWAENILWASPRLSVCRVFPTLMASRVIEQQWEDTSLLNTLLRKLPCDKWNNDVRHNNDIGSQCNNDLRDVAWRTYLECQYSPKITPFTILFDFIEPNYSDQLVKENAWKATGGKMETPAKLWVSIHVYTYWRKKLGINLRGGGTVWFKGAREWIGSGCWIV